MTALPVALALLLLDVRPPMPAPPKAAAPKAPAELARQARPAVVVITFAGRDGKQQGLGAGFVLAGSKLIATNLHVLGEGRPITVQTSDGQRYPVTAVHASDRSLDLALLRIDARELPGLELGDSDALAEGEPVVALGHPAGLKHSVVNGIVSGRPTIEGQSMIQLAIPIEPGNSGGPLLDGRGRVVGILTLKSQRTPNLGFAMPANALKALLRRPNPIPMSRWITLGRLDPGEWTTLFAGQWRRRNGVIHVEGPGAGFGGRSLCLAARRPPAGPFEVAVTVRLGNEAGAGGLVFHADGRDKHYGFYPSAGQLRLSRFEGPDVFSWHVLVQKPSKYYRPGEWNRLKVRVEKDRISCYVNGQLVITSDDNILTDGKVGLVKFRDTHVEFKRFQLGPKVDTAESSPELAARLDKLLRELAAEENPSAPAIDRLAAAGPATPELLNERARTLELRASKLRALGQAVHDKRVLDALEKTVQGDDGKVDLVRAALLVARLDNPDLDVDASCRQVDQLGREIAAALPKGADERAKLTTLNRELFEQRGFHGSRIDYYNRANSYLNEVLDDREGLPITLSLLYLELGRRLGLDMVGISLPGHFLVEYRPSKGKPVLLDVYEGGKPLTREEAGRKARAITGEPLRDADLAPVGKRALLVRLVQNLVGAAQRAQDLPGLIRYESAILVLAPDHVEARLIRAGARYQAGDRPGALADLDWLLERAPQGVDRQRLLELRRLVNRR